MNETIVGILGALLIVGGMVTSLELREGGPSNEDVRPAGPPPLIGQHTWRTDCRGPVLGWTPPASSLADHVAPYRPATDGDGNGLVYLVMLRCDAGVVDGQAVTADGGAFLNAKIEAPALAYNGSVDLWFATIEAAGFDRSLGPALDHGRFDRVGADVTLDTTEVPLGPRRTTFDLDAGGWSLEGTVTMPSPLTVSISRVVGSPAPGVEPPALFVLEEQGQAQGNGQAQLSARGPSWLDRLGLSSEPDQVFYFTTMSFDADILHPNWA